MTKNQIEYAKLQEQRRANRSNEQLTALRDERAHAIASRTATEVERKNREAERQNEVKLGEEFRSNVARETETKRANLAREQEQHRSALAVESEAARKNRADEAIRQFQADEIKRHNIAQETETTRSNQERESETHRANLAREIETNRSNVVNEGIAIGRAATDALALAERTRHDFAYEEIMRNRKPATISVAGSSAVASPSTPVTVDSSDVIVGYGGDSGNSSKAMPNGPKPKSPAAGAGALEADNQSESSQRSGAWIEFPGFDIGVGTKSSSTANSNQSSQYISTNGSNPSGTIRGGISNAIRQAKQAIEISLK